MLERFEKLLEIAKNDEEFKKELADCLDKAETIKNLKHFQYGLYSDKEIEQISQKILRADLMYKLIPSSIKLLNDELSFAFEVSSDKIFLKYDVKNYRPIDLDIVFDGHPNASEEDKKRIKDLTYQKIWNELCIEENKALCSKVVLLAKTQDFQTKQAISKTKLDELLEKLDETIESVDCIPHNSVNSVSGDCSDIVDELEELKAELKDLFTIKLI